MTNLNQEPEQWDSCPTGEISSMVVLLKTKKKKALIASFVKTASYSFLFMALGLFSLGYYYSNNFLGGIPCHECIANLKEYHAYRLEKNPDFNTSLASSMQQHLKNCPPCRTHYQSVYPNRYFTLNLSHGPSLAGRKELLAFLIPTTLNLPA